MPRRATPICLRRAASPTTWLVGLIAVAALLAPVGTGTLGLARDPDHAPTGHAHATDARALAVATAGVTTPDPVERRGAPGAPVSVVLIAALVAIALAAAAAARPASPGRPRVAFRRRGPPLLQPR